MTPAIARTDRTSILAGGTLAGLTALSWYLLLRGQSSMVMAVAVPSFTEGSVFTLQWGVMMAAMMLPSAAPMILLYRRVRANAAPGLPPVIPASAFTGVYLLVWLALGLPVYLASVLFARAAAEFALLADARPYALAGLLAIAGAYQWSSLKHSCLRQCESPLTFLMSRWRTGYRASVRIAFAHAGYCVGCCWALMVVLVAVGSMSLPWVLLITAGVFAEKLFPRGQRSAQVIGALLILAGAALVVRPELAGPLPPSVPMAMPM